MQSGQNWRGDDGTRSLDSSSYRCAPLDHMARRGTSRDKARPYHRHQRHHELVDRQIHSGLSISVLFGERPASVEDDVEFARLLGDAPDVLVYAGVIKSIDHRRLRFSRRSSQFVWPGLQVAPSCGRPERLSHLRPRTPLRLQPQWSRRRRKQWRSYPATCEYSWCSPFLFNWRTCLSHAVRVV